MRTKLLKSLFTRVKLALRWLWKVETLARLAAVVTIVAFPVLVYQLIESNRIASSQNNIALNTMFFSRDANVGIVDALENERPILKEHNGQFNTTQLDNFLGDFETINQVYEEGLLSEAEFCTSFSHYVILIGKSDEVNKYLAENSKYFGGYEALKEVRRKSKTDDCQED